MKPKRRDPPIWCCIPWERGEIAAKLGITRKQLLNLERAGFYRLRQVTRQSHVISTRGFPPELALRFNTPPSSGKISRRFTTRSKSVPHDPSRHDSAGDRPPSADPP
ncbi:MAG TPA: hypothetical protein VK797_03120 [Tepidisphaeraceae bacterium]|jgi:hypothetical protein|nr:hypothetical protein [Tepidisphaeraceae bacterium]